MKAVAFRSPFRVEVRDVEPPQRGEGGVLVRVKLAGLSGRDLHVYEGRAGAPEGFVLGHELVGEVAEAGEEVRGLSIGDKVACFCEGGAQAQFACVPRAEKNCVKLPTSKDEECERDFLMLADAFPAAFAVARLAKVMPGSSCAVYGAGAVGLLAAQSALLSDAAHVYIVDQSAARLKLAAALGATPINFRDGNPIEQIRSLRRRSQLKSGGGEEGLRGIMSGIDAVGFQALALDDSEDEQPGIIIDQLAELLGAGGSIGVAGTYLARDERAKSGIATQGKFPVPLGLLFQKKISLCMETYDAALRCLLCERILAGKVRPGNIISHEWPLEDAAKGYALFDLRGMEEGAPYIKIAFRP